MNIYKVNRLDSTGYDEYDSFIVVCGSKEKARNYRPGSGDGWPVKKEYIEAIYLGKARKSLKEGIILGSYNAG